MRVHLELLRLQVCDDVGVLPAVGVARVPARGDEVQRRVDLADGMEMQVRLDLQPEEGCGIAFQMFASEVTRVDVSRGSSSAASPELFGATSQSTSVCVVSVCLVAQVEVGQTLITLASGRVGKLSG